MKIPGFVKQKRCFHKFQIFLKFSRKKRVNYFYSNNASNPFKKFSKTALKTRYIFSKNVIFRKLLKLFETLKRFKTR